MDEFNSNSNSNSNDNINNNGTAGPRVSSFYTESYRKPQVKNGFTILQLIAVGLVCSILGAFVFGAAFIFVAPNLQPSVKNYISKVVNGDTAANTVNTNTSSLTDAMKKVEVLQQSGDTTVTAIAEKVGPSVVGIKVTYTAQNYFFGEAQQEGEGSGIIIRSNGYIMTNYHVVEGALDPNNSKKLASGATIEVYMPNQDEKQKPYTAQYVSGDMRTDLAVIKINATDLQAAEFGDSDKLKVGELAVAIGNPGGIELMGSVTAGVISGLNRDIQTDTGSSLKLIQTDAAISPGNSGGALVNSKGQVIGINEMKIAATGFEGLGFAIPVNLAKSITDQLIDKNYVSGRPYLGLSIDQNYTEDLANQYNLPIGAYVAGVVAKGPSDVAGIKIKDIITKVDGVAITGYDDLETQKGKHKPGDTITLQVYRRDANNQSAKTINIKVKLVEMKD